MSKNKPNLSLRAGIYLPTVCRSPKQPCTVLVVLIAFGLYVVKDQQDWFWDPSKYHDAYPGGQIPDGIRQLYRLEISHYLFSLLAMFTEPGLKDFWAMASHHLFTLTLLVTSYMFGATKYGTAIMLLHDVADPWMECAKIALYLGKEWVQCAWLARLSR